MKGTILRSHASLKGLPYTEVAQFVLSSATKREFPFSHYLLRGLQRKTLRGEIKMTKEAVIEHGRVNN